MKYPNLELIESTFKEKVKENEDVLKITMYDKERGNTINTITICFTTLSSLMVGFVCGYFVRIGEEAYGIYKED